jgi:hypothetical protein
VNDSWESARRHPTLTMAGLFAAALVGVGMISYFGPGGRELYPSLATRLGCGLVLAWLGWRETHEDAAGLSATPGDLSVETSGERGGPSTGARRVVIGDLPARGEVVKGPHGVKVPAPS